MKHVLIFFLGIFSASIIQGAIGSNKYADIRQAIDEITNTYFRIAREVVVNSTKLSDFHNEKINLSAHQIVSDTKNLINELKNEWERDGKKYILQMVEGIDVSACSNDSNVYQEYANELLNRVTICTSAYSQNISQIIQDFNNTVRRITEDAYIEINTIKGRTEDCLNTYASVEGSNIYACTQNRLGELPNVSRNRQYLNAEMNLAKIVEFIETNIYSCKLNQEDKKNLKSKLMLYNNYFSQCVVEKERQAHNAFKRMFDRNNFESSTLTGEE